MKSIFYNENNDFLQGRVKILVSLVSRLLSRKEIEHSVEQLL